jgi:hypothetical protein
MQKSLIAISLIAVFLVPVAFAAEPGQKGPAKGTSPLDDELLKGLGDDPLLDLEKPATKDKPSGQMPSGLKPSMRDGGRKQTPGNPLDDELFKDLGGQPADHPPGKPGTAADDDPLVRLNRQMRQASDRIRSARSDEETQKLQQKIVRELDELIKQAQQQQQQKQKSKSSSSSSSKTASREKIQQPQQQSGRPGNKPSNQPAKDSNEQLTRQEAERPDMAKMQDLLKDIWGELPPRLRQQMMQSSTEKFLPKYELLIEKYFRTLADRQENSE